MNSAAAELLTEYYDVVDSLLIDSGLMELVFLTFAHFSAAQRRDNGLLYET